MKKKIDLTKILKDCPKGTKLYSMVHGGVSLINIGVGWNYPIIVRLSDNTEESFTARGKLLIGYDNSECVLFPSKDQRDWSKFTAPWLKKEKFDPKTLKPFDEVVVRNIESNTWRIEYFSHINERRKPYQFYCSGDNFAYCIPYNDETKHLVGTRDEAPNFYKYWED